MQRNAVFIGHQPERCKTMQHTFWPSLPRRATMNDLVWQLGNGLLDECL